MYVLDGGPCATGGSGGFGHFSPNWFEWHIFKTELYSTHAWKFTIFPYGQYIVANICSLAFGRNVCTILFFSLCSVLAAE